MKQIKLAILALTLIVSGLSTDAFAQVKYKVLERSSKKTPQWVNGMQKEYIITSSINQDAERAKELCLEDVKIKIIEAVAQNIQSSTENSINQSTVNNKISSFIDEFSSTFKTQAANIPFVTNISYSNVEDYYWEKRRNKSTGKESYFYSIKYPFPAGELKKMIAIFNQQDAEMDEKLDNIEKGFTNIKSIEEIDIAVTNLRALEKYFFDDVRLNRTKSAIKNYNSVYGKISLRRVSNKLGDEEFALMYGDNFLSYTKPPRVKANTAYEISTNKKGDVWEVKYNYSTCYADEENYLDVSWSVNNRGIKNRFYINLEHEGLDIYPTGEITLIAEKDNEGKIEDISLFMSVRADGHNDCTIESIKLKTPYSITGFTFENINKPITDKGIHTIDCIAKKDYKLSEGNDLISKLASGVMMVKNSKGKLITIEFAQPLKISW